MSDNFGFKKQINKAVTVSSIDENNVWTTVCDSVIFKTDDWNVYEKIVAGAKAIDTNFVRSVTTASNSVTNQLCEKHANMEYEPMTDEEIAVFLSETGL